MAKKGTTRKSSSKKTTKKASKPKIEKIEKKGGNQSSKVDGRKNNGGARAGAGAKADKDRENLVTLKEQAEEHALAEVSVEISIDGKEAKTKVKLSRADILLNILFSEGVANTNIPAIKEYFDRTRGKSRQPVEHSGEIKTEDQFLPTDPATIKAHETYVKERKKLIAQGYEFGE